MANYISKRGANVAPSYATTDDLPASTEVGDLVFVGGQLGIAVSASGYQTCDKTDVVFPADWTTTTQQAKLVASDPSTNAYLGNSVSMSGDTVLAGATYDSDKGAAYVFTRSGTSWSQQTKLLSSDLQTGDELGYSVAIDGDTAVVSARKEAAGGTYAGAIYIFTRSGTTWSQQAKVVSSDLAANDYFGHDVAISGDTVLASSLSTGTGGGVYVFTRSGTTWSQQAKLVSSDIAASDKFGSSVAIDGDDVVVGANDEDTGGNSVGSLYVFTRSGTSWSQQAKVQHSNRSVGDDLGLSVSINADTIAAGVWFEDTGASNAGSVYIFTRSGTTWSQEAQIQASSVAADDFFGYDVAVQGDVLAVGARYQDSGGTDAGAAYVFTRSGTTWSQQKQLLSSDIEANDQFGMSVAIDGNTVVGGTTHESSGASRSGAVYTFLAG